MQTTITLPKLKQDSGTKWFEERPEGTRVATINDFQDEQGRWLLNMPYLIHSEQHPERYYALRTVPEFIYMNDFGLFLEKGRVYVFEKLKK